MNMLFERDRSCLVVIDVQQYFLDKLPAGLAAPLVARIAWFMRVASALGIPIVATAEDIANDGPLLPELAALLPAGTKVFDKLVFGLYGQADIRDAVAASGRSAFVLVGLETDVCVAHSALGLAAAGHRVAVIEDACGSPPPHHEAGLRRIRDAGILVTTLKGMHYEWVRDLATLKQLKAAIGPDLPAGMTL
ncbi:isochorismatase family protein [Dongia sp.]|uniref:isochorismatase family protein n=1 Tax=Dongia sp. TaxID=1977262 RepID=UPI003752BFF1